MILRVVRSGIAQLLLAVLLGGLLGVWRPSLGIAMKPLSDLFVGTIGLVTPVVMFVLICSSVASLRDYGTTARLGLKALGYWQLMSLLALLCGMLVTLALEPGTHSLIATGAWPQDDHAPTEILFFAQIPSMLLLAFEQSLILKVLLAALLAGLVLGRVGERGRTLRRLLDDAVGLVFRVMHVLSLIHI